MATGGDRTEWTILPTDISFPDKVIVGRFVGSKGISTREQMS